MILVMTGVSGSGKTTIGKMLAGRLQWEFFEGDDYHPVSNIKKMAHGEPLTDEDRLPWINKLQTLLLPLDRRGQDAVLTCSALKESYRRVLRDGIPSLQFVYLRDTFERAEERLLARKGHFMPPELLRSQFDTLEDPEDGLVVDVAGTPQTVVQTVLDALGRKKLL